MTFFNDFYQVICFYMGSRTLLQIILMAFFLFCKFVNIPLNCNILSKRERINKNKTNSQTNKQRDQYSNCPIQAEQASSVRYLFYGSF